MIRSLWTGAAGMVGHQTYLDVLGNNVGNINTVGFRRSSPRFEDLLFSTQRDATGAGEGIGGINPLQVGHGSLVHSIDVIQNQGPVILTAQPSHMAVEGEGYFPVQKGADRFFTRAGNFDVDASGRLVQPGTGAWLLGTPIGKTGMPSTPGALEAVQLPQVPGAGEIPGPGYILAPQASSQVLFRCNLDASFSAEDSHAATVHVYDSLGGKHALTVTWKKALDDTGSPVPNAWTWNATLEGVGNPVGEGLLHFAAKDDMSAGVVAGTLLRDGGEKPQITLPFPTASDGRTPAASTVTLDFTGGGEGLAGVTQFQGPATTRAVEQDGYGEGVYLGFAVEEDGTLAGHYSNDIRVPLYRLPLACFRNPMGLAQAGDTNFSLSSNSGEAQYHFALEDGAGKIRGGAVEMSNVDTADAFTDIIVAQRSYQANARIVTTSDAFLKESITMKR